jgi:adenylosuccinate synthase
MAAEGYETAIPLYESMPGWSENSYGVTSFDALPQAAQNYIKRLEEITGLPMDLISTGPDRNETMIVRNPFDAK